MTLTLAQELKQCKSAMVALVAIRKAKGISQIDLAHLMETDQAFISRLEGTPDSELHWRNVKRYAAALGLDIIFRLKRGEGNGTENGTQSTRRRELV